MESATLVLRPYLRVSQATNDVSPTEQHDVLGRDCAEQHWSLHPEPYRDLGSASRYARKARDDYERLVADLEAGQFGAQILGLWESSRGSRRVGEWAILLDLLEDQQVRVWVHTHRRLYDPANSRDRRTLLEDAVDSEYESSKTSDRMQRSHASRAALGRAVGRLSYGYTRSYDPSTGTLLGRVPHPEESKCVAELFDRFVAGESIRSITQDWRERGITNRSGRSFTGAHLRDVLRNRVYIAERVHVPGEETRWWRARDRAVITPGQWEPLVSREVFFRVQEILDDPSRVHTRPGGARHLLSMIAVCDSCEGPMCSLTPRRRGVRVYRCRDTGCTQVDAEEVDEFATEVVLAYLSRPDVHQALTQRGKDTSDQLAAARAEMGELSQHYRDLKTSLARRRISVAAFEELEPQVLADLEVARTRVRELETPPVLRGLLEPGEEVRDQWASLTDVAARRAIMRLVLHPGRVGQLRVVPSPTPGHRVPADQRIVFRG